MKTSYLSLTMVLIILLSSCNSSEEVKINNDRRDIKISENEQYIIGSKQYQLSKNVLEEIAQNDDKNIVFSPLGLLVSLGMSSVISDSQAQNEIMAYLSISDDSAKELHSLSQNLISNLPTLDKTVDLVLANGIWYDSSLCGELKKEYLDLLTRHYYSQAKGFDCLHSDASIREINSWGAKKTNNFLPNVLPSAIEDNASVIFSNIQYFKGRWTIPFDKDLTSETIFYSYNGLRNKVPMMNHKKLQVSGFGTDVYTAISLPYGNSAFNMVIVLPDENKSISECITPKDMERFYNFSKGNAIIDDGIRTEIKELNIKLPKFSTSTTYDFCSILKDSGVAKIFDSNAQCLSAFTNPSNAFVRDMMQTSIISIDEDGTELATTSSGDIYPTSILAKKMDFIVDRPFVFMITEKSTGAILFFGRINVL